MKIFCLQNKQKFCLDRSGPMAQRVSIGIDVGTQGLKVIAYDLATHAIVGRAIFVGLSEAVREIRQAMDDAREADRF